MTNINNMNDDELKKYQKRLLESHVELLRDKSFVTSMLFFYGLFACVGMLIWCIEEALQYQEPLIKYVNYFLIISGACSLYFSHKRDKDKIVTKSFIADELSKVNNELYKRGVV
ncbi:TPA: hypothetical protein LGJ95_000486 [Escherichia coli]|nr:hypothetical protein [Escherichia coli]